MIVRTYGRRNRAAAAAAGAVRSYSDTGFEDDVGSDSGGFRDSLSQESPRDIYDFTFSSQDSSHWGFDLDPYGLNSSQESRKLAILPPRKQSVGANSVECDGVFRKPKKARNGKSRNLDIVPAPVAKKLNSKWGKAVVPAAAGPNLPTASATATLMETQEYGEMMEHVDEVNFALDGLKKGQPVRVRRASLLSLLSICGSSQQRRLLRSHGMAKTIIDAVLGLSFDDFPSSLASAALFYVLTSDGQDDNLLDSSGCIRFLIKLLRPLGSDAPKDKAPTFGSRLLLLRKDADCLPDANQGSDSTTTAIMLKVQEIFFSYKEMKSKDGSDNRIDKAKLSPKWVALLTMEKACLSTISLEETSGTMRKTGSSFKERLRELGGLDAVFQVMGSCHSILEGWLKGVSSAHVELNHKMDPESLVLLLKCLKIMENSTFLSMDNQSHLLGMEGCIDPQRLPLLFTKLILSFIKILSDISLLQRSAESGNDNEIHHLCNGSSHCCKLPLTIGHKADGKEIICIDSSSMEWMASQKSSYISQSSQLLSVGRSGSCKSSSATTTSTLADPFLLKMRIDSSTSGSCSGTSRSSYGESTMCSIGSKMNLGPGKVCKVPEETKFDLVEDSQDPFAFNEDDFEPSKWDLLFGRQKSSQNGRPSVKDLEDGCQSVLIPSQQESSTMESSHSHEASCSFAVDVEMSNLLADCLLTAVKVLMNLTNDNSEGCQQIAACGGLEVLCSLIAGHFPSFGSYLSHFTDIRERSWSSKSSIEVKPQNDIHLTDYELDFLVAILGLLVNLVEKDGRNRSQLAAASVPVRGLEDSEEGNHRDVIPLLCSIFLANQGAGEAAGDGNHVPWDGEEDAVLQGEKEAEKMIVEAYAALLLAFLSTESKSIRKSIAECLPHQNLAILVPVLERFVEFHLTLNMISPETHTTVLEVIESCRVA